MSEFKIFGFKVRTRSNKVNWTVDERKSVPRTTHAPRNRFPEPLLGFTFTEHEKPGDGNELIESLHQPG